MAGADDAVASGDQEDFFDDADDASEGGAPPAAKDAAAGARILMTGADGGGSAGGSSKKRKLSSTQPVAVDQMASTPPSTPAGPSHLVDLRGGGVQAATASTASTPLTAAGLGRPPSLAIADLFDPRQLDRLSTRELWCIADLCLSAAGKRQPGSVPEGDRAPLQHHRSNVLAEANRGIADAPAQVLGGIRA